MYMVVERERGLGSALGGWNPSCALGCERPPTTVRLGNACAELAATSKMAGEGGRRALRPRASTSAAAAPSDNVRQTRAATKRSAMDECRSGSTVLHPRKRAVQPSGRRAPLTDISKLVNAAPSGCPELGGAGELKCQELKPKAIVEGDENAVPEASEKECARAEAEADSEAALDGGAAQEQDSRSSSSAVASLERRTSHTLFISKESKDRVKQGELFSDKCQEESSLWSDGLAFRDINTDHSDPQMCSTYAADIYMHLRMAECESIVQELRV